MGTRHLILVYYKRQYHIAQYGQWDGYPGGQGLTVLEFVSDPVNLSKLTAVLDAGDMLYEPTHEPLNPSLSRDTGAEILKIVADATEPVPIIKALEFITDGIFCEWAYVVDLDEGAMEVYSGSRDKEGKSRFRKVKALKDAKHFPSLVGRWKFTDLPTKTEFLDWFSK
ncbi:hypothetical protein C8Q76DRAFT_486387 [Earliella scabrosa]|nr:hypothetical protein C8Q76DRAFT_486387 [Earliella scabrosa]